MRPAYRVPPARLMTVAILALLGLLLLILNALDLTSEIEAPTYVAVGLIGLSVSLALVEMMRLRDLSRRRVMGNDALARVLSDALDRLDYRQERNVVTKTLLKPGILEVSDEEAQKRTSIDRSRADLVGDFRDFVRAILHTSGYGRIVIAVDELDKLASADDLIAVINDLKDLFHIRGVHFLVSVSNEALDSFAMRGVRSRDAFDSTFDSIIEIESLTPLESVNVLRSRATGFPRRLSPCSATRGPAAARGICFELDEPVSTSTTDCSARSGPRMRLFGA